MRLTALENTPVDYTAEVKDDFIAVHNLQKGRFNSIGAEQMRFFEEVLNASRSPGGSAANVCHGFANLGLESAFIGSIGNDEAGAYYAEELQKAGVIPYLETKRGPTGKCLTLITPDRERTFAMNMGKSSSLCPWQFDSEDIEMSDFFHTTAYALDSMYWTVKRAMKIAKKNKVKVSFDLASVTSIQRHRRKIRRLLENYVGIVFANEEEAMAYTGADNPYLALDRLASDRMAAVVKMGSKGAMARGSEGSGICAAYSVSEVKNTNGAGDASAAGFLYGIAKGCSIRKSLQIGAFYASKIVEVESARLPYKISNIEELI
ncbi:MAG: adenosine kinase [Nanoarchaeota archaeon]|nr:adenosine kinase [Nanoarchaeota archaeon]